MLMRLLYILPLFHLIHSSPSKQPLCHDDESSALLQFKESFIINKSVSWYDPVANHRVKSWTLEGANSDCCSWDGVDCDEDTGHVIGLDLSSSCLYGSINSNCSLFRLVYLQNLNLADNHFNYSQIPSQLGNLSRLTYLNLSYSMFSGQIPSEISKLSQLSFLDLCCNYDFSSGKSLLQFKQLSLTSLAGNLTRVEYLDLGGVNIFSTVPNIIANLSTLRSLYLHDCGMHGEFPVDIFKLPKLLALDLKHNKDLTGSWPDFQDWSSPLEKMSLADTSFFGELPVSMGNFGSLIALDMWGCNFSGSIPSSIGNLTNLIYLKLSDNSFAGNIPSSIGNLIQLAFLDLYGNELTGPIPIGLTNITQLTALTLGLNQLTGSIPFGLMNLTQLYMLSLDENKLQGKFPISIFNLKNLNFLGISQNYLIGTLLISNMTSVHIFDASDNYFTGSLPHCLHNIFEMRMISVRGNKLQGMLPRSLANCTKLEAIDISNNQFNDTFPSWLGNLPNLKLLLLQSNKFYGQILGSPESNYQFPKLQILDLSYNNFTGNLPLKSFGNWNALKLDNEFQLTYIQVEISMSVRTYYMFYHYDYKMQLTNKGLDIVYDKVQDFFRAIDLSSNSFVGEIPDCVGDLKGLHMLNLSNNILTGHIPTSIGNLIMLESLDLSQNKLTGEIPPQLIQLTFLEWFNVSHNHLIGSIPQGKQFDTFENSSFEGNLGLCGNPLSKKCWNSNPSPPLPTASEKSHDSTGPLFEFGWKIVLIGYGFGLIVGVIIGNIVATRKRDWLMKTFGLRQRVQNKMRRGT
ncbi:receptor-like protein 9DC3 [Castanea sativa]|uniref:receptor-like protein 9DC3 n=1 Tax=Castanea sativa TaxID=21020 RepID=UPI003F64E572